MNVQKYGAVALALLLLTFLYLNKPKVALFVFACIILALLTNKWGALQANFINAANIKTVTLGDLLTDPSKTGAGTRA